MYPWLWWWSPSFNFPFSGAVNQDIETDWFSDEITPESGDATIERKVFRDVASYGTQLGLLNEAVLALAQELDSDTLENNKALRRLKTLQEQVQQVKNQTQAQARTRAKKILDQLVEEDPDYLASLLESYATKIRAASHATNNGDNQVSEVS
ncbi:hypothetical protein [Gloeothece verrucosa]|uniref:Uncharacterized protein n=1 Tax=Gloeothece verrucosa (strain PCC 7822) TaxID=497965 RepID=E0U6E0_GLOV7|nr:hypothetical protein [Gloeothece verrucosa]ADN13583.1 conserved hypothetical protein [Gloeothece verrucosa PCC 7822]